MPDIPRVRFRWDLVSKASHVVWRIKSEVASAVILMLLLHMPTPALAVAWPIERRYFEDKIPERQTASEQTGKSWTDPLLEIGFVFVPAGCFDMGDSAAGIVGKVCVDDFFLSQHEITNAQFRRFRSTHKSGSHLGHTLDDDDQPVVNVSWRDAMAFAAWLSKETDTPVRLATEAEWEYACGHGLKEDSTENVGRFGNLRESDDEGGAKTDATVAVGSYPAEPQGTYDMHGNASEWVLELLRRKCQSLRRQSGRSADRDRDDTLARPPGWELEQFQGAVALRRT